MSMQGHWRWCNKCQGLAYAGNTAAGACPAHGEHDHTGSGHYFLIVDDPAAPGQANWRWCNKLARGWPARRHGTSARVLPAAGTITRAVATTS